MLLALQITQLFIESFQYKDTTPLDRYLRHDGLLSATLPPVSDSHREFGYYSSTPSEKIIVNEEMEFAPRCRSYWRYNSR